MHVHHRWLALVHVHMQCICTCTLITVGNELFIKYILTMYFKHALIPSEVARIFFGKVSFLVVLQMSQMCSCNVLYVIEQILGVDFIHNVYSAHVSLYIPGHNCIPVVTHGPASVP